MPLNPSSFKDLMTRLSLVRTFWRNWLSNFVFLSRKTGNEGKCGTSTSPTTGSKSIQCRRIYYGWWNASTWGTSTCANWHSDFWPWRSFKKTRATPKDEWRVAIFVKNKITREELTIAMEIHHLCYAQGWICHLETRGLRWPQTDTGLRDVQDGDYVVAKIEKVQEESPMAIQDSDKSCTERASSSKKRKHIPLDNATDPEPRDSGNDDSDVEDQNLVQFSSWTVSFAMRARERLPPPGNGPKNVRFNHVVDIKNGQDDRRYHDATIENEHVAEMCEELKKHGDNPFVQGFNKSLRWKEKPNHDVEDNEQLGENNAGVLDQAGESILPIALSLSQVTLNTYEKLPEDNYSESAIDFRGVFHLESWLTTHCLIPHRVSVQVCWVCPAHSSPSCW